MSLSNQNSYGVPYLSDSKKFLSEIIQEHYSLETMGMQDGKLSETESWLQKFKVLWDESAGRYEINLPFNNKADELRSNQGLAIGRLISNRRHLTKNPELLKKYSETFAEQERTGVIERVKNPRSRTGILHYIPHQPVVRMDKETTKMRIVSDASARQGRQGLSLNDTLEKGPNMLKEIIGILLRCRIPNYLMTSDIEKAFLQVQIHRNDRDALRFFWFEDPEQEESPIIVYRFARLPFGLICSPAILATVIKFHLDKIGSKMALKIQSDLYVDNVLLGLDDREEILQAYYELKQIFHSANMNLREFCSNALDAIK